MHSVMNYQSWVTSKTRAIPNEAISLAGKHPSLMIEQKLFAIEDRPNQILIRAGFVGLLRDISERVLQFFGLGGPGERPQVKLVDTFLIGFRIGRKPLRQGSRLPKLCQKFL
jgi:hypothetical protein